MEPSRRKTRSQTAAPLVPAPSPAAKQKAPQPPPDTATQEDEMRKLKARIIELEKRYSVSAAGSGLSNRSSCSSILFSTSVP
ncbi:Protein of unknown function [Pyronema omphalodes CBS 100304]|uniref:Uncharacterized protein n=1 Tax=Pyronema omphalodes (strain CBS 100304) TaxID=1076935 RepID=U4LET4_PYROM|nr:Protein of unknown function [Pyronema omphalodes CBS 100304]